MISLFITLYSYKFFSASSPLFSSRLDFSVLHLNPIFLYQRKFAETYHLNKNYISSTLDSGIAGIGIEFKNNVQLNFYHHEDNILYDFYKLTQNEIFSLMPHGELFFALRGLDSDLLMLAHDCKLYIYFINTDLRFHDFNSRLPLVWNNGNPFTDNPDLIANRSLSYLIGKGLGLSSLGPKNHRKNSNSISIKYHSYERGILLTSYKLDPYADPHAVMLYPVEQFINIFPNISLFTYQCHCQQLETLLKTRSLFLVFIDDKWTSIYQLPLLLLQNNWLRQVIQFDKQSIKENLFHD